jgi:class 3 adenylate cyclase
VHRTFAIVLFTDVVESTKSALAEGDASWKERLDAHDRAVDQIIGEHSGTVVKSTGDGILATFDSLSSSLDAATALVDRLGDLGIPIRACLHSGEIELREDDVSGAIVNLAARVMDAAGEGAAASTIRIDFVSR